jgi:phosphatidylglycerol:prolipoprotein diacylglycerol transferase
VPWAFVYNGVPRHASQLYEAILEGMVLGSILWVFTARPRPRLAPSGLFLFGYGLIRFAIEFVRVPDDNRGYLLFGWVTEGQLLSVPMIAAGIALLIIAYRRPAL